MTTLPTPRPPPYPAPRPSSASSLSPYSHSPSSSFLAELSSSPLSFPLSPPALSNSNKNLDLDSFQSPPGLAGGATLTQETGEVAGSCFKVDVEQDRISVLK